MAAQNEDIEAIKQLVENRSAGDAEAIVSLYTDGQYCEVSEPAGSGRKGGYSLTLEVRF